MSEAIKAGDLVVVVGACCQAKYEEFAGIIGTALPGVLSQTTCLNCWHTNDGQHFSFTAGKNGLPYWWFKRIPPFDELEDVKRDEEIEA